MGLLGGYLSDTSQSASFLCRLYRLPQITYAAAAQTFDDKTAYPTFFRGLATLTAQTNSLARLVYELGYRKCAVIGSSSLYDQSGLREFQTAAGALVP
jgi:ABC-type branched-subunit amino acid transport system substrate-binding protein